MKAIVTGGAGFIGSHLVDLLIEKGHEVTVIDDLSTGKKENLNPKARFLQKDITQDYRMLLSFFSGADCVFHFAAWARLARSVEDPIGTNNVNVGGTLNILQICRQLAIKKVVLSSSSSIYGIQDVPEMVETMKPKPMSPYGLQKLIGEQYAEIFAPLYQMKIVSLRYFNVYGPRQLTEGAYTLVIGKFMDQKKNGLPLTIYGDGTQCRAYTHVSDVANANYLAAITNLNPEKEQYHEIFNVGTSTPTSVNRIADMIGGERKYIDPNPRGAFEEKNKYANYTKAKTLLGWEPKVTVEEGVSQLVIAQNEKDQLTNEL